MGDKGGNTYAVKPVFRKKFMPDKVGATSASLRACGARTRRCLHVRAITGTETDLLRDTTGQGHHRERTEGKAREREIPRR
jgi:hypothetical protein